ncbi:hypothetical protein FG94_00466 [Massilia sp. LC238]|nr:hypothetical protein FG94_00466 [Massilia sp. LC238]
MFDAQSDWLDWRGEMLTETGTRAAPWRIQLARPLPAHQRYDAGGAAGRQIHPRLVMQHEVLQVERPAQLHFRLEPGTDGREAARLEEAEAVLPFGLDRLHRDVRILEQGLGILAVLGNRPIPPRARPRDVKKPGRAGLSMQQRRGASYMMWVPIHQAIAAMKAEAGMVKIQAQTMLPATPQRTADIFCEAPTPTIAPVMVWVVETGMPK